MQLFCWDTQGTSRNKTLLGTPQGTLPWFALEEPGHAHHFPYKRSRNFQLLSAPICIFTWFHFQGGWVFFPPSSGAGQLGQLLLFGKAQGQFRSWNYSTWTLLWCNVLNDVKISAANGGGRGWFGVTKCTKIFYCCRYHRCLMNSSRKQVLFLQNKGKTAQVSLKAFRWDADHFSGRQNKGSILRLQK